MIARSVVAALALATAPALARGEPAEQRVGDARRAQPESARGAAPLACPAGTERKGGGPPDLFEEWCEGKDDAGRGRREGPARTWYDDGGLHTEESFHEGQRHGPFVERHRNGKVAREGRYAGGLKVGVWRVAFESGAPEEESEWRDGTAHGRFRAWWPGGAPRVDGRHCGGAQCGRWRTFDASGKVVGEVEYGEQTVAP